MSAVPGHKAVLAIAALTLTRIRRSAVIWVALFFAAIPLLPLLLGAGEGDSAESSWQNVYDLSVVFQCLVGCLLMAPIIAEEIENKTYAYLWSRPIPRWSVLVGKLVASWLVCAVVFTLQLLLAYRSSGLQDPTALTFGLGATLLGLFTVGACASALGIFSYKHPLPVSMGYFLIMDAMIGAVPFSGARISVIHNIRALAGFGPNANTHLVSTIWLVAMGVFWLAIGNWRLGRKEMSTGS